MNTEISLQSGQLPSSQAMPDNEAAGAPVPILHSVTETAGILTVSPRTVWTWIHSAELGHYRLGRNIRVSDSQIAAFLEGRERSTLLDPEGASTGARYSKITHSSGKRGATTEYGLQRRTSRKRR